MKLPVKPTKGGVLLFIRLTPKASANKIGLVITDSAEQAWLKVYVTAVPESGKANQALIKLLAEKWKLAKGDIVIISGQTTSQKILEIAGLTVQQLVSLISL